MDLLEFISHNLSSHTHTFFILISINKMRIYDQLPAPTNECEYKSQYNPRKCQYNNPPPLSHWIKRMEEGKPFQYICETELIKNHTDMDHFPYTRFFRGRPTLPVAVVHSREAGYCAHPPSCRENPVVQPTA